MIHINELRRRSREKGYRFSKSPAQNPETPGYDRYELVKIKDPYQLPVTLIDGNGQTYRFLTLEDIQAFVFDMLKLQ